MPQEAKPKQPAVARAADLEELQQLGFVTIVTKDRLNEIKPNLRSFEFLQTLWVILTASAALDLIWVPYFANLEQRAGALAALLPWLLTIIATFGLSPGLMFSLSERLQRFQSEILTRHGRRLLPFMLALLPFVALLEITSRFGVASWIAITIALVATAPIAFTFAPKIRAQLEGKLRHPRNRYVRLQILERRTHLLALVPMVSARAVSIAGAIVERSSLQFIQNWQAWFAISVLALILLKPGREDWIWRCPHCGAETPRGLGRLRYCLACVPQRFRSIRREHV